jgi:hypothetical protein
MKFGKRRKDAGSPSDEPVVTAAPEPPPETGPDSWTVPTAGRSVPSRAAAPAAAPPPSDDPPDAVVEGEAVEIPAEPRAYGAVPPAAAFEPPMAYAAVPPMPEPTGMPFPAAAQPIGIVTPGSEPERITPLGSAADTFASGHGPAPAPAWPEAVQELAADRPEVVVGAAFVGGILAALILRRLGN